MRRDDNPLATVIDINAVHMTHCDGHGLCIRRISVDSRNGAPYEQTRAEYGHPKQTSAQGRASGRHRANSDVIVSISAVCEVKARRVIGR